MISRQAQVADEMRRKRIFERDLDRRMTHRFTLLLRDFRREYARSGLLIQFDPHQTAIGKTLAGHYRRVQADFSEDAVKLIDDDILDSSRLITQTALGVWISDRVVFQSLRIVNTVKTRIERGIRTAIAALAEERPGLPPETGAVARTARNILAPTFRRHAQTIGRTETQAAAEATKSITAEALGGLLPRVLAGDARGAPPTAPDDAIALDKVWVTEGDELVRQRHAVINGQSRGVDDPFDVGREQLMFPGDTSFNASLGNIINCRCAALYERRTN